jgi:hypothetical protein
MTPLLSRLAKQLNERESREELLVIVVVVAVLWVVVQVLT